MENQVTSWTRRKPNAQKIQKCKQDLIFVCRNIVCILGLSDDRIVGVKGPFYMWNFKICDQETQLYTTLWFKRLLT